MQQFSKQKRNEIGDQIVGKLALYGIGFICRDNGHAQVHKAFTLFFNAPLAPKTCANWKNCL